VVIDGGEAGRFELLTTGQVRAWGRHGGRRLADELLGRLVWGACNWWCWTGQGIARPQRPQRQTCSQGLGGLSWWWCCCWCLTWCGPCPPQGEGPQPAAPTELSCLLGATTHAAIAWRNPLEGQAVTVTVTLVTEVRCGGGACSSDACHQILGLRRLPDVPHRRQSAGPTLGLTLTRPTCPAPPPPPPPPPPPGGSPPPSVQQEPAGVLALEVASPQPAQQLQQSSRPASSSPNKRPASAAPPAAATGAAAGAASDWRAADAKPLTVPPGHALPLRLAYSPSLLQGAAGRVDVRLVGSWPGCSACRLAAAPGDCPGGARLHVCVWCGRGMWEVAASAAGGGRANGMRVCARCRR